MCRREEEEQVVVLDVLTLDFVDDMISTTVFTRERSGGPDYGRMHSYGTVSASRTLHAKNLKPAERMHRSPRPCKSLPSGSVSIFGGHEFASSQSRENRCSPLAHDIIGDDDGGQEELRHSRWSMLGMESWSAATAGPAHTLACGTYPAKTTIKIAFPAHYFGVRVARQLRWSITVTTAFIGFKLNLTVGGNRRKFRGGEREHTIVKS
ncbi:hypothetical protein BDZ91DRAFT_778832 [Kalaharituber pfeilii]|nr:hypothetical protein BDZ91DRAFT_778832 [Kalaharituber pfeilii]